MLSLNPGGFIIFGLVYIYTHMYVLDGNFGALPNCSARSFKESKSWSTLEVPFWRCVDPWNCRSLLYLWPLHFFIHTHIYLGIYLCLHILMHIHMHILITHECRTWWWYSRKTTVLIHQCFSHLLHIPGLAINHHVEKTYTQSINIYIYTRAYGINNNIWICFSHIYIYVYACMHCVYVCMHACMYVCYVM
jgi:hypothetical protein